MSIQADQQRDVRRHWARPGGSHDRLVGLLKNWLPVSVGVLAALLATAPFTGGDKVSFVLDKNKVEVAKERMRVTEALYRGERSEEHTSELQSLMRISYAVFCLKKKKTQRTHPDQRVPSENRPVTNQTEL